MVKAIINIDDQTNRVLNIVKAKYGLKDKSSAIELVTKQYEEELLGPELRPEYIEKAKRIMAQDAVDVGTVDNLRKRLGI
ncbi:DUF2683 family protein [Methanolobus sp. WCC5]|jgi:hypothetical protein|uniref:DUF2683 family protein n=1 Tax=Methanolobus sp. WCC5 TaxID=3125785 RepID=UPI0032430129